MKRIIEYFTRLKRKREARKEGVPFREREWYNYRAMLPSEALSDESFIEIFDEKGEYMDCPGVGGMVVYNHKGKRYSYRVIGFKNEPRNRDWLYGTDYINPVIEYCNKLKENQ